MNLLKPAIASAAMLFGGVAVSTPDTADAQIRFSIGNSGYYGNGYGYRNNYGYGGYGNYRQNYGYRGFGWGHDRGHYGHRHNRGHYDYHPTTIVPHGNHYDVIPGHYDWHDTSRRHRGHHDH